MLLDVELNRFGEVFEHQFARLHHVLRLRVVVAFVVLLLVVDRLELFLLVDLREDTLVIKDLEGADS